MLKQCKAGIMPTVALTNFFSDAAKYYGRILISWCIYTGYISNTQLLGYVPVSLFSSSLL
jgi:hypothetical protein